MYNHSSRNAVSEYTARRTAEVNADADAIAALPVGAGISVSLYTDIDAYTIIKKTATTMTLRRDHAVLANNWKPEFIQGGFAGHCVNQADQTYTYSEDPDGAIVKISLRRSKDENGNERRRWKKAGVGTFEGGGNVYPGRRKFHDYNF